MSIKQVSPGKWLVDVRTWKDGKEYRHRESVEGSRRSAQAAHDEAKKRLHKSALNKSGSLTFSTFGQALVEYTNRNDVGRSSPLFDRLKADLGNVPIEELASRYDKWAELMKHSKGKWTKRPYSAATMNRYLAWSNAALNLCVRHGFIEANPLRHLRKAREIPRSRILQEDEKNRLLGVVSREAPHLFPLVQFTLQVPCRRGEATAMRREWYDPFNQVITIPAEATKNKSAVMKPVPPNMKEYFQDTLRSESPHLFYRVERGRHVPLGDFSTALGRCLRLANISDWHFHDGRRQAYTQLILNGSPASAVQRVSGHKTDMSRVYLSITGMQAAGAVKFGVENADSETKPDTSTGHLLAARVGNL